MSCYFIKDIRKFFSGATAANKPSTKQNGASKISSIKDSSSLKSNNSEKPVSKDVNLEGMAAKQSKRKEVTSPKTSKPTIKSKQRKEKKGDRDIYDSESEDFISMKQVDSKKNSSSEKVAATNKNSNKTKVVEREIAAFAKDKGHTSCKDTENMAAGNGKRKESEDVRNTKEKEEEEGCTKEFKENKKMVSDIYVTGNILN